MRAMSSLNCEVGEEGGRKSQPRSHRGPAVVREAANRGNGYQDVDDRARAITDYTKAIEINPFYAAAYNNRGYAYALVVGLPRKAVLSMQKIKHTGPARANGIYASRPGTQLKRIPRV